MRRKIRLITIMLLVLLLPLRALADAGLGEYIYGQWSDWGERRLRATEKLEVQTRESTLVQMQDFWTYRRYIYFNVQAMAWYASCTDEQGALARPGSGRWEQKEFTSQKQPVGHVFGEMEYEGHWFFEQHDQRIGELQTLTQYRGRSVRRVNCQFDQEAIVMARGDQRTLSYKLADGVSGVGFISSDSSIASVGQNGVVTAHRAGEVTIYAMYDGDRTAQQQLLVGERMQAIKNGYYTLQQASSLNFLTPKSDSPKKNEQLLISTMSTQAMRTFTLRQRQQDAFQLGLTGSSSLYMGVNLSKAAGRIQAVKAPEGSSKTEINFGVLQLKDGSCLMYPATSPDRFIGMNEDGGAQLKAFDLSDETLRWHMEKVEMKQQQVSGQGWVLPVEMNGVNYLVRDYEQNKHEGVDIGSHGMRNGVLSVAAGRVVTAFSGCEHDFPKQPNAHGEMVDPCGEEVSQGNFIVIEHEGGVRTVYQHLSIVNVKVGDKIRRGQLIGMTGSSGAASGVHLHFEVRRGETRLDPRQFLDLPKTGKVLRS